MSHSDAVPAFRRSECRVSGSRSTALRFESNRGSSKPLEMSRFHPLCVCCVSLPWPPPIHPLQGRARRYGANVPVQFGSENSARSTMRKQTDAFLAKKLAARSSHTGSRHVVKMVQSRGYPEFRSTAFPRIFLVEMFTWLHAIKIRSIPPQSNPSAFLSLISEVKTD